MIYEQKFNEEIKSQRTDNQAEENVGVAQEGQGKEEMEQPKNNDAGEISHMRMAGSSTEALVTAPDAEDQIGEIFAEVKFRMKSVPAGEEGARSVIFDNNKKTNENENKGVG